MRGTVVTAVQRGIVLCLMSTAMSPAFAGQVVLWGSNGTRQTNVPPGLDALSANCGSEHVLAVRSDHTVAAWGWNGDGQTNVPAGLSNVVATAGGERFSLALKADGTVVGWGNNSVGQTNTAFLQNVVAIAAGI